REEYAYVDAFTVHVAKVRRGIELVLVGVCKALAPALRRRKNIAVVLHDAARPLSRIGYRLAVDFAHGLVRAGEADAGLESFRQVFLIQIRWLQNVSVGVDNLESVAHK